MAPGLLSNGKPVLAWYEDDTGDLLISWGNTAASGTNAYDNASGRPLPGRNEWQANVKVVDSARGQHVDMVVDAVDTIHLAYYDLAGGLYYANISAAGGEPNMGTLTKVKVDTYLTAGTKLMLNVRQDKHGMCPIFPTSICPSREPNTRPVSRGGQNGVPASPMKA